MRVNIQSMEKPRYNAFGRPLPPKGQLRTVDEYKELTAGVDEGRRRERTRSPTPSRGRGRGPRGNETTTRKRPIA